MQTFGHQFYIHQQWTTISLARHILLPNVNVYSTSSSTAGVVQLATFRKYKQQWTKKARNQYLAACTFYEQFMRMDDVWRAQQKVIDIQQELQIAQQERRALANHLTDIRDQIQRLHEELSKVERFERRYVDLVGQQYSLFQQERTALAAFELKDTDERELFTRLTIAVKVSHEKEKIYANTVKYWSIIGSIIGATLGIIGTVLSFQYRAKYQNEIVQKMTDVSDKLTDVTGDIANVNGKVTDMDKHLKRIENSVMAELQRMQTKSVDANVMMAVACAAKSWTQWTWRNTVGVYRYFVPKVNE